jgi:hypothetical protein
MLVRRLGRGDRRRSERGFREVKKRAERARMRLESERDAAEKIANGE